MTRKLQLEVPTFNQPNDYSFPYWTVEDRVIGQPLNQMTQKYKSTYGRVAAAMIKMGPHRFQKMNVMGLLATNYASIPHYIQEQFVSNKLSPPSINDIIVIEKSEEVIKKIDKHWDNNKPIVQGDLYIFKTMLANMIAKRRTKGRGGQIFEIDRITEFQETHRNKINFIDADFMCNWGKEEKFDCIAELVNTFSAQHCVVHVNAISSYPRTVPWSTSHEEILSILQKRILDRIDQKISNVSIETYNTYSHNNVKTEMTSAVFAVGR
jgi:hypothetical protein